MGCAKENVGLLGGGEESKVFWECQANVTTKAVQFGAAEDLWIVEDLCTAESGTYWRSINVSQYW